MERLLNVRELGLQPYQPVREAMIRYTDRRDGGYALNKVSL